MEIKKTNEEIINFLRTLDTRTNTYTINDYLNEDDLTELDQDNAFDSLQEILEENYAFDIEIIYYTTAIKYLADNDRSLRNSLKLANDIGLTLENLNSETLASLLASEKAREDFQDLENDINKFFEA